ncbi:MAG TPA: PHP domain-containing protein [Firmicutes bacterium]|nr:PHP domain-containing protein [Bacillota bacterium]
MELVADLHIHTIASGHAYSTYAEIVEAAAGKGLEAIALTDHGPAMTGAPYREYFGNLTILPEKEKGVEILRGIEANIIDRDGTIDLTANYLKVLDLVWAGFHIDCLQPAGRAINTEALLGALNNPYVDGIVHPGNPDFAIDEEVVVREAVKRGKVLEINNSSFIVRRGSTSGCLEIARTVRRFDGLLALSSDAHVAAGVGDFAKALKLVEEVGIPPELILNADMNRLKLFLKSRGKRRFKNIE